MYLSIEQRSQAASGNGLCYRSVETLLEKGSGDVNEDVLFHDTATFGVCDGATSLYHEELPDGLTGGYIAAQLTADHLCQEEKDLFRCVEEANEELGRLSGVASLSGWERFKMWSTSAAAIRLDREFFDYCQIGDSLILLIYENDSFFLLTPDSAHDRETLRMWMEAPVSSEITIQEYLAGQLRAVRNNMNITYGVLNGEAEAMRFLNHGRQKLEGVSAILLFTDGLSLPKEDPCEETDWASFVSLYRQGGLQAVHKRVRELEREDSWCRRYPRFKKHDDIAAIAIAL